MIAPPIDCFPTDQSNNQHDSKADDVFAEVAAFVVTCDCKPRDDSELDKIVWKTALADWACKIGTKPRMNWSRNGFQSKTINNASVNWQRKMFRWI